MSIKSWIRRWLASDQQTLAGLVHASGEERTSKPAYRLTVLRCLNGRAIEIGTYKPNPHGPDWTFDMFIVPEGDLISDAIVKVLAIKALEN